MTDTQLRNLYKTACAGKNYEPTDGQFKVWKQTLGWCEEKHLAQALVWWFESNQNFPMPADLKPLAEKCRRQNERNLTIKQDLVRWHCPECGIFATGFVPVGMEGSPQVCRGNGREGGACNELMGMVYRDSL
jgi:hypothetical protein